MKNGSHPLVEQVMDVNDSAYVQESALGCWLLEVALPLQALGEHGTMVKIPKSV